MVYKDFPFFASTDLAVCDLVAITDGNPCFSLSNQALFSLCF